MADFMDVANITFGSFAAFFHEYVHYLQDVTTLYGLMNLGNVVYYLRNAAARVGQMPNGYFDGCMSVLIGRGTYYKKNKHNANIANESIFYYK